MEESLVSQPGLHSGRTSFSLVWLLVGIIIGSAGGYGFFAWRFGAEFEKYQTAQDEVEKSKLLLKQQEYYVQVAEMTTDAVVWFAMGNTSTMDITESEAKRLVDRVNKMGKENPIVQTQFTAPLNAVRDEFEKDMAKASGRARGWRELAKYWEDKYASTQ